MQNKEILQAHRHYHSIDCPCPWCVVTDENELTVALNEWTVTSDAPILLVSSNRMKVSELVGVGICDVECIDPYTGETETLSQLTLPTGTKMSWNGGWARFQLPNHIEFEHAVKTYYDSVEGYTTGSSVIEAVKPWYFRWPDSVNQREGVKERLIQEDDDHPF